jgi:tRNA 2-thiouridine synthesizing protein D|tara:strand:- start:1017 stop:1406 length:390 start_codon:yes stop_codon:yes gene_type:complete
VKFTVVVHSAPYSTQAASSAYRFTKALLEQGHDVYRLFFFGDGVHNTSKLTVVAQDDTNWQQQWNKLIELQNLDSVVCVTSAIKRGIIDEAESARHELGAVSLSSSSEISGLGQLIDATINSDRVINFG